MKIFHFHLEIFLRYAGRTTRANEHRIISEDFSNQFVYR